MRGLSKTRQLLREEVQLADDVYSSNQIQDRVQDKRRVFHKESQPLAVVPLPLIPTTNQLTSTLTRHGWMKFSYFSFTLKLVSSPHLAPSTARPSRQHSLHN